jgi:hypothetical protein
VKKTKVTMNLRNAGRLRSLAQATGRSQGDLVDGALDRLYSELEGDVEGVAEGRRSLASQVDRFLSGGSEAVERTLPKGNSSVREAYDKGETEDEVDDE